VEVVGACGGEVGGDGGGEAVEGIGGGEDGTGTVEELEEDVAGALARDKMQIAFATTHNVYAGGIGFLVAVRVDHKFTIRYNNCCAIAASTKRVD
jgi:hypothetical protein